MLLNEATTLRHGIRSTVEAVAALTSNPVWVFDPQHRLVARSVDTRGSDFRPPRLRLLLERAGLLDLDAEPVLVASDPARGLARRHLLVPVSHEGALFAWLVLAEVSARCGAEDRFLANRAAFHLAREYVVQRRIAAVAHEARAALTRQLVRGSTRKEDLALAADYLGVRAAADRILVYLADSGEPDGCDWGGLAAAVARELDVEVLDTRGREGTILLVETLPGVPAMACVERVKQVIRDQLSATGRRAVVGVSGVTPTHALRRAYRETREVALCVDRFARAQHSVIGVDDLGPARLFVANGEVEAVRRYVEEVLGGLLGTAPGSSELLRTLQCFFEVGRSVRESAGRLGVHENTVRLRLAKVHTLTGLDVACNADHQLSAQTALLVLRLEGHSALPSFAERDPAHGSGTPARRSQESA